MPFYTTFFTFDTSSIDLLAGYTKDFISNVSPLLFLILAVGLGIFIVTAIIGAFRH